MATNLRYPAEWESHKAVWLAWPSHQAPWEDTPLTAVEEEFSALCRAISDQVAGQPRGEILNLLVANEESERRARATLGGVGVAYHRTPFGDIWLRDTAPIFLQRGAECLASVFQFNGWGEKFIYPDDDTVSTRIANISTAQSITHDWILEGGSVESDGEGTILTTEECLLNLNRNPGLSRAQIEAHLEAHLGAKKVLWLKGGLLGDHTDGHIDNIARFVAPGHVLCMEPSGEDDPNRSRHLEIIEQLRSMTDAAGRRLAVYTVPSPGKVLDRHGELMAASHVNFYISNTSVIVPLYPTSHDDVVLSSIKNHFPDRKVIGLPAWNILHGGGSFHCITQQVPSLS
jgi:agmatine deiminase